MQVPWRHLGAFFGCHLPVWARMSQRLGRDLPSLWLDSHLVGGGGLGAVGYSTIVDTYCEIYMNKKFTQRETERLVRRLFGAWWKAFNGPAFLSGCPFKPDVVYEMGNLVPSGNSGKLS